ncbi:T9SS type A sorting domain-containing protein [bacterium]|nr:T9SS type A sorting domain-containing protein [bacterium]MBU1065789.1 T9SS type A sorting domain-containing protein [bacterium]MBU1635434.1 T9SS type A sorting domain-containing protein [bacterium]MBU1873663.1 T9SS type A sorting domain-containing protein [bacterium]
MYSQSKKINIRSPLGFRTYCWLTILLILFSPPTIGQVGTSSNSSYSVEFEVINGGVSSSTGIIQKTDDGNVIGQVDFIIGQPFISLTSMTGVSHSVNLGFWAKRLRVPGTPIVSASYDIFSDRIQLKWRYDPNDPPGTANHKIFRNYPSVTEPIHLAYTGEFLWVNDKLPSGQQYEYRIQGSNTIKYANTYQPITEAGIVVGKTSTNGKISGFIQTNLQSPIPNVSVKVYNETGTGPAWGNSVDLNGTSNFVQIPDANEFEFFDQSLNDSITMELWFRPDATGNQTLISKGNWTIGLATDGLNYITIKNGSTTLLSSDHTAQQDEDQAITVADWNHIALVRTGSQLKLYIHGKLARINSGSGSVSVTQINGDATPLVLGSMSGTSVWFNGKLDEFRIWGEARDNMFMEPYSDLNLNGQYDSGEYFTDINKNGLWGGSDSTLITRDYTRLLSYREEGLIVRPTMLAYFNMDLGSGSSIINTVNMDKNGSLSGTWAGIQAPVYPTGYTDKDGAFQVKNLNFGEGTTFRVIPAKPYHEFSPLYKPVTLDQYNSTNNEIDFKVTNMITVSGFVTYNPARTFGASCGERYAEIWIDGEYKGHRTDSEGYYLIEVEPGKTMTISPHKAGWDNVDWEPKTKTFFNIISPQSQSFIDTKRRTLRGSVTGGDCKFPLGPEKVAKVILQSTKECFSDSQLVDASGSYAFIGVPIMSYQISVKMDIDNPAFDNVPNMIDMNKYFLSEPVVLNMESSYSRVDSAWITEEDTVDFNWHSLIEAEITGFPVHSVTGDWVYEQNRGDSLQIFVFERYYNNKKSPLEKGIIHIKDWISDRYIDGDSESDTMEIEFDISDVNDCTDRSQYTYKLLPGLPNLLKPYKKNIEILVSDTTGVREKTYLYSAVVLGQYPRLIDYVTGAPELPFLILRRPPGDGSMASFSESHQVSTGFAMSFENRESGELNVEAKLGVETEILTAPMGVGTSIDVKAEFNMSAGFSMETKVTSSNSLEFTTTTSTEYTTATAVELMGDRGTIFVGGALNLLYGQTDVLEILEGKYAVMPQLLFVPDGFATTYVYSRGYVEDYLIPELTFLSQDSAELVNDIIRWRKLLAYEDSLRWKTPMNDNYSISGGGQSMTITHSAENSQTITFEEEISMDTELATKFGVSVAGSGFGIEAKAKVGFTLGNSSTMGRTNTTTTSFTLMDDDTGDDFTVDVGTDPVYGTPVFNVVAGNMSCPYEEWRNKEGEVVTTPRDEPGTQWMTPSTAVNVLVNDIAEFWIQLQNKADNIDVRTYELCYLTASNPHGADIKINGQSANESNPIQYTLEQWGVDSALITVAKPSGSDVYEFDDLRIKFAPPCETNYAGVTQGYTASFSVHFARPCTDAQICKPDPDWVINLDNENILPVIVQDYDLSQSYFDELFLQFSNYGDDAWASIDTLNADTLRFYKYPYRQLYWDVSELEDGIYDIRLRSSCLDGLLSNEMSPLRGIIDREKPKPLGLPEPIDGVLNITDEIALNFTEDIDPVSVSKTNIELKNTDTYEEITDFEFSLSEDRLVITPGIQNKFIENYHLTASVTGYRDIYGNTGDSTGWNFIVNRNPVSWSTPELTKIAFQGNVNQYSTKINNIGSSAEAFEISDLPEWMHIEPSVGVLNPGGSFDIQITIDSDLNVGEYSHTILAKTSMGDEPLTLSIVSMCPYPVWEFEAVQYEYSMNITANLAVLGFKSEDMYDRVGAFINGECRGIADLKHVIARDDSGDVIVDDYIAYLTVHSNEWSGEKLEFHLWDRTDCEEYWEVDTVITFIANSSIGTPVKPVVLNATGAVGKDLVINKGFTWLSLNLDTDDMSVAAVLDNLTPESGDRIIAQNAYAQYSSEAGWAGTLTGLNNMSMYMTDISTKGNLIHVGYKVNPIETPIILNQGWNWISYIPDRNLNVNEAMVTLNSQSNDLIKNQTSYAQYVDNIGWLGSLNRMYPGSGYMIRSTNKDTLIYPNVSLDNYGSQLLLAKRTDSDLLPGLPWSVDRYKYQSNMTITAIFEPDSGKFDPADAVAAIVGREVRGVSRVEYIPQLNQYVVFLMVYGKSDETVSFKIWDASKDIEYRSIEELPFVDNTSYGNPVQPHFLTKAALQIGDKGFIPDVYSLAQNFPNPFNPLTNIGFGLPKDSHVSIIIYNLLGQQVKTLASKDMTAGYRYIQWDGKDNYGRNVTSGVYLVMMQSNNFHKVRKMVLMK